MSLFDSGCDDGAAGLSRAAPSDAGAVATRIAAVDRYMGALDLALARQPTTLQRRHAWTTLLDKWRVFAAGGGLAGVADRYLAVAGAFAAELGAKAPAPPPTPAPAPPPPASEKHWLRWTLVVGGLGAAGYFGWRWYASRRPRLGTAEPGPEPGPVVPELSDSVRVLTANPAHNPPAWVRDEVIWANAKSAVRPYWERYHDPYAVVTEVYRKMGGRITDQVAA